MERGDFAGCLRLSGWDALDAPWEFCFESRCCGLESDSISSREIRALAGFICWTVGASVEYECPDCCCRTRIWRAHSTSFGCGFDSIPARSVSAQLPRLWRHCGDVSFAELMGSDSDDVQLSCSFYILHRHFCLELRQPPLFGQDCRVVSSVL